VQLADVLRAIPKPESPDLLVGFDHSDDAGVLRLPDGSALVQTVDFFTPIVDDPYAFGQIAAANALSDVYAMGGRPITALNIACFDPATAPAETWAQVLLGMAEKTRESGATLLGGHSVEDKEPKFGMAVTGLVDPARMFANTAAKPGDRIYLTKPLGTGIVTTAAKFDRCPATILAEAVRWMATLNAEAAERGREAGVRCATDITGFGLLGHLLHIARASGVEIHLDVSAVPAIGGAEALAEQGLVTGGAGKNLAYVEPYLRWGAAARAREALLLDPQTSGGLALFASETDLPYPQIGEVRAGDPAIFLA